MKKRILILSTEEARQKTLIQAWMPYFEKRNDEVEVMLLGERAEQTLPELPGKKADIIIGFDLEGFEVEMFGEDAFFNKLSCPFISFLTKPLQEETLQLLDSRLNITMVFLSDCMENVEWIKKEVEFPPYAEYVEDLEKVWENMDFTKILLYGYDFVESKSNIQTMIVIDSKKKTYHNRMAAELAEVADRYGSAQIYDMAKELPLHEKYYALKKSGVDFLVSFDCAGFELRTENDTLSYNNLDCRMAHILFRDMEEYREELKQQMNFSMFLFSMKQENVERIREHFPNIPNVEWMERPDYQGNTKENHEKNREIWESWFSHVSEEAEL